MSWKELTLKVLPCYLGSYPGWIEVVDGDMTLVKQPIGEVNSASTPQQTSQLTPSYRPSGVETAVISEQAAMFDAVEDLLDTYRFLAVWKKILLHQNAQNDLVLNIVTDNESKALCIPFETVISKALRERGRPGRPSEIPKILGSNPSIIFRRKWGSLNSGLESKINAEVVYYYSGTRLADGHENDIESACSAAGKDFIKIDDLSTIQTDRPWILYFIGHGGSNGIWNESSGQQNLLSDLEKLDFTNCKATILNCCRTSSFLKDDEIMTRIFKWNKQPDHIFANSFSVVASLAMDRGISLIQDLLSNTDIHEALSNCIMSCPGTDDQQLSFYWFDCT